MEVYMLNSFFVLRHVFMQVYYNDTLSVYFRQHKFIYGCVAELV